jgi:hypothetical protein
MVGLPKYPDKMDMVYFLIRVEVCSFPIVSFSQTHDRTFRSIVSASYSNGGLCLSAW